MSTFKAKRKIFRLRFEDPDMNGLVVRAHSTQLGNLVGMARLANLTQRDLGPEDVEALDQVFRAFADALIEWNLVDDNDVHVPETVEGLYSLDQDFAIAIIAAWQQAISSVSAPLGQTSNAGGRSLAASLPMGPRSTSQAS